jgi:hypothetical protein
MVEYSRHNYNRQKQNNVSYYLAASSSTQQSYQQVQQTQSEYTRKEGRKEEGKRGLKGRRREKVKKEVKLTSIYNLQVQGQ